MLRKTVYVGKAWHMRHVPVAYQAIKWIIITPPAAANISLSTIFYGVHVPNGKKIPQTTLRVISSYVEGQAIVIGGENMIPSPPSHQPAPLSLTRIMEI